MDMLPPPSPAAYFEDANKEKNASENWCNPKIGEKIKMNLLKSTLDEFKKQLRSIENFDSRRLLNIIRSIKPQLITIDNSRALPQLYFEIIQIVKFQSTDYIIKFINFLDFVISQFNNRRLPFEKVEQFVAEYSNDDSYFLELLGLAKPSKYQEAWKELYPYLDQIGTIFGLTGSSIAFYNWLKKKSSKDKSLADLAIYILKEETWNFHILATRLEMSDLQAKNLLKGFGYKWDKKNLFYRQTDSTIDLKRKLNNIEKRKYIKRRNAGTSQL